jgi:antitoxin component YwqK of YwqJK toxin-antitoxin module
VNYYKIHCFVIFCDENHLKLVNKFFYKLDYEKYNTHIKPHGIFETYYPDSKIVEKRDFWKNGEKYISEIWYDTRKYGNNPILFKRCNYKNGKLNGLYEQWYLNGHILKKCNYKNNKLHGLYEQWYQCGQLAEKYWYKKNCKHGLYEQWYQSGQLWKRFNYKNDMWNGLYEVWNENGTLEIRNFYEKIQLIHNKV